MGYLSNKRYRRVARLPKGAMGDITSDITGALTETASLASDPYAAEIICHIQQVAQVQQGQAVQQCTDVPYGTPSPAGLQTIIYPIRFFAYAQQNPWIWAVALGVIFGLPMYVGYDMGYTDGRRRGVKVGSGLVGPK